MDTIDQILCGHVEALQDECRHLSDSLWDLAETAYGEYASVERQIPLLQAHGFRITREAAGLPTGFIAEAGTRGPVIGLLGEYDALPQLSQQAGLWQPRALCTGGNGHGCGHNLLGAAALLASLALKRWLDETGQPGTVRYYGCPAEEGGAGKTFMVRAGVFDDLDAALTWHPASLLALDAMTTLATIHARFRFVAPGPDRAKPIDCSARDAATLLNVGANYLREHVGSDARIHYAVIDAGGAALGRPQLRSEVLYQLRAPRLGDVTAIFERLRQIGEGAALMTGSAVSVRVEKANSDMRPNTVLSDLLYDKMSVLGPVPFDRVDRALAAESLKMLTPQQIKPSLAVFGGEDISGELHTGILPREKMPPLLMASTDVGDVSRVVPTARFLAPCFVVGTPFHSWQLVAQGKSTYAHKGMVHAARLMAVTAGALYAQPRLVEHARAEHARSLQQEPYVCPIPDDVAPPLKPAPGTLQDQGART